MDLGLKDKVAIVSGGNKGLGAACAVSLANEGAKVFLTARNEDDLKNVASEISAESSVEVGTLALDITEDGAGDKIVTAALEKFGRIDIVVNGAGAARGGSFLTVEDQVYRDAFELKFLGAVRLCRAAIPHMQAQKYGRIVNIIGMFGREPAKQALPASAVNAAFMTINKGLSQEYGGDGIFVNAVDPGPTRSERILRLFADMAEANGTTPEELENGFRQQIPIGRLGEMEEVARIVTFLASDAAGNLNGTVIPVDGGMVKGIF
ncbi:MAG: SDR family oxidoreductase [Rhodospirillaceae bacterium]|jgi:NAD(P)-dependent dehydrogenase (short-subunit alcohol dehydrogenase family)|nr:SDR family oxidoreductase [Rhodospirillaceae bacterium]MBT4938502.1 SDR family oxidoreductase [Rhodospirillaceae bacterium]MBT7268726.1 SDR family oxidoreductase [Rhodospirillaceae bacterium]